MAKQRLTKMCQPCFSDAMQLPGQIEQDEVTESTQKLADSNSKMENSFMDSLLYVMLPSLLSFLIIFFAFYLLHSFTDDEKRRKAFYAKINKNCSSLKVTRRVAFRCFQQTDFRNTFKVEKTRSWKVKLAIQMEWRWRM